MNIVVSDLAPLQHFRLPLNLWYDSYFFIIKPATGTAFYFSTSKWRFPLISLSPNFRSPRAFLFSNAEHHLTPFKTEGESYEQRTEKQSNL